MNTATRRLRYHLRIPANLTARVTASSGHTFDVAIVNISRAGMMISCGRATLSDLIPRGAAPAPKHSVDIHVNLSIPLMQQGQFDFSQVMSIAHSRRLAKDEFRVGLEFQQLNPEQKLLIEQYIEENRNNMESV
jgi:hypothetical protein